MYLHHEIQTLETNVIHMKEQRRYKKSKMYWLRT